MNNFSNFPSGADLPVGGSLWCDGAFGQVIWPSQRAVPHDSSTLLPLNLPRRRSAPPRCRSACRAVGAVAAAFDKFEAFA